MRIAGIEIDADAVRWLEEQGQVPKCTRSDLARSLCEHKRIVDARGRARVIAVRIDLARHAAAGRLKLPPSRLAFPSLFRRTRPPSVNHAERGPCRELSALAPLRVDRVLGAGDPLHEPWTKTLSEHHYLGAGALCGAQVRYVVRSGEEIVAVASFSAAALQVAARDVFIGWSAAARTRNRSLVIAQSRLCVCVDVKNLASQVQSLLVSRVAADWEEIYGVRPVLIESYVDTTRFDGACYGAANWQQIGSTKGRGRQDREHAASVSIKDVWVYPLDAKFRETLCVEPVRRIDETADWAVTEWGDVDLGDARSTRRLLMYGKSRFAKPTATLPLSCGTIAATKAAYRLLNQPEATLDELLSTHRESALARAARESVILAIQDTTSLNFTSLEETTGLGPIAANKGGANATRGLMMHNMMLASTGGTPFGLLDVNCWARDPKEYGKSRKRARLKTEDKESQKWIRGYHAADKVAKRLNGAQVVVVCDREGDMFDLFDAAKKGHAQVLVRALHPRRIASEDGRVEGYLWDSVRQEPVAEQICIEVPRSGNHVARTAHLELRYREVRVVNPTDQRKKKRFVKLYAIAATEPKESAGEHDPIEWLLLTTLPISTPEEALEKVQWYTKRWLIEVFHRTLKSGCNVEERQATTAEALIAALAVDAVVAWRVMWLHKLGRETPNLPCSVFFEEHEWKALYAFTEKSKTPPPEPPPIRDAMRRVAKLGGFLARKCDGEPGTQTIWRGLQQLSVIAAVYRHFFSSA